MDQPLVVFDNVSKNFHAKQVLQGVSLELKRGEIFGYIGPNGAGKTTTMKILVGLIHEFNGKLEINGFKLPEQRNKVHELIGYLPQGVSFQRWRTVEQGLMTMGRLSGVEDAELRERIPYWLQRFQLGDVRKKKVRLLSGGMMQKVGFIQALLHKPALLVLDEPLAGLDPQSRLLVKEIIRDLRDEGTTIIFSSHILSDVQDVADRLGLLNHGRLAVTGTLQDLKATIGMDDNLMIEYAKAPVNMDFLQTIAGKRPLLEVAPGHYQLMCTPADDRDALTDTLIRESLAQGGQIRQVGKVATSLDLLYTRYLARK